MIAQACYQTGSDWRSKTAAQLAAAITAPAALRETRLTSAFGEAVQRGADITELGKCYSVMNNEFVINLRDALHDGDLEQVSILVAIAAGQLSWPLATQNALNATIAAHTLTLIEQVAEGLGETAPDVDEAAVVAALTEAGFTWDGAEWGRGD